MNRRKFLKNTSATGLALTTIGIVTSETKNGSKQKDAALAGDSADFELNEMTIDELQQKMQAGVYTSAKLTELYLQRIAAVDKDGPPLNAVIQINPDAPAIAEQMDRDRKQGKIRGPLHGIPILVKDNIDTGDKMMTTAGSIALEGHKAKQDAFIIGQLRNAGAVLIGKTNLSEWANFRSTRSSSGWSSRGGQTKNPCVLDRNPCGSSSGSAVAVAANLCAVAVGTETDGSIIAPSSFTGIVGMKPTVGLLSRSGIIPISKTQDTAGPMTRTVKDAAILLAAMAGVDESDPVTLDSREHAKKDYTSFLDVNALQGKRIGIEKSFLKGHESVVDLYKSAIELMKAKGASIVEIELLKQTRELGEAEYNLLLYEFKDGINRYLADTNTGITDLAGLIAFNKANEAKAMPFFKQETLERSERKGNLETKEYLDAVAKSLSSRSIIDDLMRENNLDAIAATSIGPANLTDLVNGDYSTGFYFCPPAAMAGYPHITVPMGDVRGLPVGISFMAGAYKDAELLGIAYAFEQASKKRKSPRFLVTINSKI
ncbi:MAG TPA: amidase [Chitinophagaceae bacterium]|nr:amidase [Chitinophagaceae bacterium]